MNKLNIVCVTNQKYLPYFKSFVKSLAKNSSHCVSSVLTYFVNCDKTEVNSFYTKLYADSKIFILPKFIDIKLDSTENKLTRYECGQLSGRFMSDEFAFCNNLRYQMFPEIITQLLKSKQEQNILYIDVDNLVVKDLAPLVDIISQNDISIYKYPIIDHPIDWRKFTTYACGLIGIKATHNSLRFFQALRDEIVSNGVYTVGDQLDFYNVYNKYHAALTLHKLSSIFKDDKFTEDGIIWSGDGNRKQNPIFIKTQQEYLNA